MFQISSPSFSHKGVIPVRFTCDGGDVSPALWWNGVPTDAVSLVLICDDPDAPDPAAPTTTWVHWVLYNIPPRTSGLAEGVGADELPAGALEGLNDWGRTGYGGPCPPVGNHRYVFKLYALDESLPDLQTPTKTRLEELMERHVVSQTELVATYSRTKS